MNRLIMPYMVGILLLASNTCIAATKYSCLLSIRDVPTETLIVDASDPDRPVMISNDDRYSNETALMNETVTRITVRRCPCGRDIPDFFCMDGSGEYCGVFVGSEAGECFHLSQKTLMIRNLWPGLILWYIALFVYFLGHGRQSVYFVLSLVSTRRNDRMVERIIQQSHERQERHAEAERNRVMTDRIPNLVLQTRRFVPKRDPGSTHEDEICAVCHGELEEDDRIGALVCDHDFHVECLKQWLKRRNVCPLCLCPNIATPVPTPTLWPEAPPEPAPVTHPQSPRRNTRSSPRVAAMSNPFSYGRGRPSPSIEMRNASSPPASPRVASMANPYSFEREGPALPTRSFDSQDSGVARQQLNAPSSPRLIATASTTNPYIFDRASNDIYGIPSSFRTGSREGEPFP